jgi:hypothetical protein
MILIMDRIIVVAYFGLDPRTYNLLFLEPYHHYHHQEGLLNHSCWLSIEHGGCEGREREKSK